MRVQTHMAMVIGCKQLDGLHWWLASARSTNPELAGMSSSGIASFHRPRVMYLLSERYGDAWTAACESHRCDSADWMRMATTHTNG